MPFRFQNDRSLCAETPNTDLDSNKSKTLASYTWSEAAAIEMTIESMSFTVSDDQHGVAWTSNLVSDVKDIVLDLLDDEEWDGTFESDEVIW